MESAIRMKNVTKKYEGFTLDGITLDIPKGCIVGLVGENGAGKTTLLKAILDMIRPDEGEIYVNGQDQTQRTAKWKDQVGVVMNGLGFLSTVNALEVGKMMSYIYSQWDKELYEDYLRKFNIEPKKKIKDFSKGTGMKLNLAIALSHHANLLILDEATSGLDPVVRDQFLDILLEFIQDENHTVLVSTHIITDLERAADYIAFLHRGKLWFMESKDDLLQTYGLIHCSPQQFLDIPKEYVKGVRTSQFEYEVLVDRTQELKPRLSNTVFSRPSVEEIILFLIKGANEE